MLYKCLGKGEAVRWEKVNSVFNSGSTHDCVDFGIGPSVQTHKSLAVWEPSVCLKTVPVAARS